MKKRNVLVFPCGSEVGLEIHRSVNASTHFELFGGSSVDDDGMYTYKNYIPDIPFVDSTDFVEAINKIVDEHNIEIIFPAHDSVVLKLAQEKALGNLHCDVMTSPLETCEVARSKSSTYEVLKDTVAVPRVYEKIDITEAHLPLFLKPDVGQGSKGVYLARTLGEVNFYYQKDPSLLALEYLPGKEYTIDCFTNKNGSLLFNQGRERSRVSGGISVNSYTVDDERFAALAKDINNKLSFRGAWFFQVKENKQGELVLMEVATRIAGTMALVRCKGVNLALLSLFDLVGFDVALFENDYDLTIDRALQNKYKHTIKYEHVYLDFDDLVLFEGKINTAVMAFVYQCINNKIKIHLITKHKDDLHETLKKYRLENTFDSLIWLKENQEKSDLIKERSSIFIDDSYEERKRVSEAHQLPVFDAHMIESLMEVA